MHILSSMTLHKLNRPIIFIATQDGDIFIIRTALLSTVDVWTQESRVDIRRGSYLLLLNIVGSRLSALSGYMCPSDVPIRPQPHCFLQTEWWPVGKASAFCPLLHLHLNTKASSSTEASFRRFFIQSMYAISTSMYGWREPHSQLGKPPPWWSSNQKGSISEMWTTLRSEPRTF